MKRLSLLFALLLAGCVPTFEQAQPRQLTLIYQGGTLELTSDKTILRGSIGVRAESVASVFCALEGCLPDAEGRVLLVLPEGGRWGSGVILGRVQGLQKARAVIVRVDEKRAVIAELTP